LVLAAALALPGAARAQEADSVEYFAPEGGALARAGVTPYGDLRLRLERVQDRPVPPGFDDRLDLARGILRFGLLRSPPGSWLSGEAGFRLTVGSDSAHDPWSKVLNENAEVLDVDRLGFRGSTRDGALTVSVGRQRSPIVLTEMLWDQDLRPVGVALTARRDLAAVTTRLGAALFKRTGIPYIGDGGLVSPIQIAASFREEAVSGAEIIVSWLRFKPDVEGQLIRQNATEEFVLPARGLISDFDVLDVQLGMRAEPGGIPVSLRLDLARNVALDRDRDGIRVRLAVGGPGVPAGAELGWVFQRLEREATVGAFNSDDWWFHTLMRGHQIWARVAARSWLEARLAGFHEHLGSRSQATRRLTLELRARLPQN
ncbi:MAG TPA: putative porin, partial [Candidatus Eisenbacteria bacterium]|nr:putative porin [Candidatus Eisenbacteria bacterium]